MRIISKIIAIFIVFVGILQFFCFSSKQEIAFGINKTEKVDAEAMLCLETNSGRVLYAKDEHKKLPMASTTKILTAILVIENNEDLNKKHLIPKEATRIEGSSIYLKEGEHLSVLELLFGLMLRSGNDAAVALAIITSGSVENFVKLMNDKCKSLGANDTHIVTVNGLHDDEHYTTASDLAKITAYAMKNKTFAEIVSTKEKSISSELDKKYGYRFLKNKNKLLKMVEGADGVKTGYTLKAGKCFVGSVTRGNMQVVCVVLNSKTTFDEATYLLEKAFKEYKMCKLFSKGNLCEGEILNGKQKQKVPVLIKEDIFFPLKADEISKVTGNVILDENLSAPLEDDSEVGRLEIKIENNLIFSQKLFTIKVEKIKDENYFKKLVEAF